MLGASWRNFLRTKRIFFPALAGAAGLTGYILYQGMQFGLHRRCSLGFAGELQQACAPLFLLELHLSYEFLHAVRHSGLEEAVSAIPRWKAPALRRSPGGASLPGGCVLPGGGNRLRSFGDSSPKRRACTFPTPWRSTR